VVVAYSASNLVPVTGTLREMYGSTQDIVIVADHDASGVGQRYAEQASAKYGARMVMPSILGDANDYAQAGHNLAGLLMPIKDDWLIPADDFCAQPSPISWLVKRWIQSHALVMVHGPSGGGKTFVVLDWCLRMASGIEEWAGHKVRPGNVVYLAGEGHHGLRGRVAAWKHHHQAGKLAMWLSKDGCDLNTPTGYLKVVEQVRMLPNRPDAIVVDTLHRFLQGDENSAQDAKTMLDACAALMQEFGCTVILVHHTGVSEEAQHRARGSSAWRGALDIEISVIPAKGDKSIEIVQRKSKDAEMAAPVYVDLESVAIPGWFDEDGEAVTSAVVVKGEVPESKQKDKSLGFADFEKAWWSSGAEERGGAPYLTKSVMRDWAVTNGISNFPGELAAGSRRNLIDGKNARYITNLLNAKIIEVHENGWIVIEEGQASGMMLKK
jgi:hypothetical protein